MNKLIFTIPLLLLLLFCLLTSSTSSSRRSRTGALLEVEEEGHDDPILDKTSGDLLLLDSRGVNNKNGGKRSSNHGNVTLKYLLGLLADAKSELTSAQKEIEGLQEKVKILEHNSSMTLLIKNIVFDYLRTSKARLYAEKNFSGPHEDYNMATESVGVGCQNLNASGPLAGHVQSVDLVDTCIQLYSAPDCIGRRVLLTGGAGRSHLSNHRDLQKFIHFPIFSVGPCIAQPGGKAKYPHELYEAGLETRRIVDFQDQSIQRMDDRIDELQEQVERLELRALGTSYGSGSDLERWNSCGGFITLHAGVELSYENFGKNFLKNVTNDEKEEEEVKEETCVWVIWAKKGGSMTFVLKELQSGVITESLGQLTVQRDFTTKSSSIVTNLNTENLQKDVRVYTSSALLIFTSSKGQSFKLRVTDGPAQTSSYSYMASPGVAMVTANFLGGPQEQRQMEENSGLIRQNNSFSIPMKAMAANNITGIEFTHPPFSGEQYSSFERRHVILRGVPGQKIHLALEFLDTEENGDFLSVYKFSRIDNKFLFLQRYSGSLGLMENVTFEGDLNGPLFLYFHSDISVEYNGFQIFFTYVKPTEETPPPQRIALDRPFCQCGGRVILPDFNEISYENNGSIKNNHEEICIFVLSAKYGGPIEVKLEESRFEPKTGKNSKNATLSIQTGIETQASNRARVITSADQAQPIVEDETTLVLVFRSSEKGQSFRLKMRDMRQRRWRSNLDHPNVTYLEGSSETKNLEILKYSYPPPSSSGGGGLAGNYSENERLFIILKPEGGRQIFMSLDFVDTDPMDDWVQVYKFSMEDNKFEFNGRFSGRIGHLEDSNATTIYQTQSNQAMLIYFRTDRYSNGLGFKISYSYYNEDGGPQVVENFEKAIRRDKSKQIFPHTKIFEKCGGFISLDNKDLEVTFKIDPAERTEEGRDCLFMVTTTNDGTIGLTLLDDPNSKLNNGGILSILHSDFLTTENSSNVAVRLVQNGDLNREIVSGKSSLVLIFDWPATSTISGQPRRRRGGPSQQGQGQGVRVRLRELGILRRSSTMLRLMGSGVSEIDPIFRINGSTHFVPPNSAQNLTYPTAVGSKRYENAQKECLILFPASGQNLSLSVNFLDIKSGNDYLAIFRWSKMARKMILLQRLTGQIGEIYMAPFVGERDEPLMLYFQSDHYGSGRGFRLSFLSTSSDPMVTPKKDLIRHPSACGALVAVETGGLNLFYENPDPPLSTLKRAEAMEMAGKMSAPPPQEWTCVWVLWPTHGGMLRINLTSFNFTCDDNNNLTSCPILTLQFPKKLTNDTSDQDFNLDSRFINTTDLHKEIVLNETSALLIFRSRGGQSFNIWLRDSGENVKNVSALSGITKNIFQSHALSSELLPMVGANFLDDFDLNIHNNSDLIVSQVVTFSYPQTTLYTWMAEYLTFERRYVVIKPVIGRKISLTIVYVDIERDRDILSVYKYSKNGFVFLQKYTGTMGTLYFSSAKYEGDEGMPMLLYFSSDHSIQKSGFRISFSYIIDPVVTQVTGVTGGSLDRNVLIDDDDFNATLTGYGNYGQTDNHSSSQPITMTIMGGENDENFFQGTSSSLLEHLRLAMVSMVKKEMKERDELPPSRSNYDWRVSSMIVLTLLSTLTSLGLIGFFLWQRHEQKKRSEVKKTITYARTGTREAVLLGAQDQDEDTMV